MIVRKLLNLVGWKVDEKQLNNAQKKSNKFIGSLKKIGAGVGIGLLAIGTAAVKAASDMEALTVQFEVMLGSAEKAVIMMDSLKEFAAKTPFALNDLARGTQNLLAFGIAEEDVIDRMRMLGDAAGGNAEKLQSLVGAFGKAAVKGKADLEVLNIIAERGVPIFSTLADQLGMTTEQFLNMKGGVKVSSEELTQAFRTMTSEGGIFFKGMEKASTTFAGLVSTMKDNITLVLAEIGSKLLPVLKTVVGRITELFQGALGNIVDSLLTVLVPILDQAFVLLEALLSALMPIVQTLTDMLKPILNILGIIMPLIIDTVKILGDALADVTKDLGGVFIPLLEVMAELLTELMPLLQPIIRIFAKMLAFIIKLNVKVNLLFFGLFVRGLTLLFKLFQPIIKLFNLVLVPLFELLEKIITRITDFITGVFDKITNALIKGMEFLFKVINNIIDAINKIPFVKEKLKPLDSDEIIKNIKSEVIKTGDKINNVTVNQQNTFNGAGMDTKGIVKGVKQAVGTPFQLQIKKIIADI